MGRKFNVFFFVSRLWFIVLTVNSVNVCNILEERAVCLLFSLQFLLCAVAEFNLSRTRLAVPRFFDMIGSILSQSFCYPKITFMKGEIWLLYMCCDLWLKEFKIGYLDLSSLILYKHQAIINFWTLLDPLMNQAT